MSSKIVLIFLSCILFESKITICDQQNFNFTDNKTDLGNSTFNQNCKSSKDCETFEACIKNKCLCEPNYKYNDLKQECVYTKCYSDSDCKLFDKMMLCQDWNCICDERNDYYLDSSSQVCKYIKIIHFSLIWLYILFPIALIAIFAILFNYYYQKQRRLKHSYN